MHGSIAQCTSKCLVWGFLWFGLVWFGLVGLVWFGFVCYVSFYLFFLNFKPEGIEKEQTFNTLLCASGKCNKTQNSQGKQFVAVEKLSLGYSLL